MWNPTSGSSPEPPRTPIPGDAYVDYVGLDLYDQVWGVPLDPRLAWPRYVTEANGLRWLSSFASAHHKPAAIPEWGVTIRSDGHGLGDDPLFVAKMAQWISTHDVAFTSYFDVDAPDGAPRPPGPRLLPVPGGLRAVLRRVPRPASCPTPRRLGRPPGGEGPAPTVAPGRAASGPRAQSLVDVGSWWTMSVLGRC